MWKIVWCFFSKFNIGLLRELAVLFIGIYIEELKIDLNDNSYICGYSSIVCSGLKAYIVCVFFSLLVDK